jgi:hypothetical protein
MVHGTDVLHHRASKQSLYTVRGTESKSKMLDVRPLLHRIRQIRNT